MDTYMDTQNAKNPSIYCKLPLGSMKKAGHPSVSGFLFVSHTGFEPVTSALSRQRSKPTELMALTVLSTNILT